jgi:4-carboxymuconolactone decarboxylase
MVERSFMMAKSDRAYPADVHAESGFRLPLPKREDLAEDARRLYDRAVDPKSGSIKGLRGPGGIKLYSPKVSEYGQPLTRYLRWESGFDGRIRELAILVTAREADSVFEWQAHEPEALKEGVPQATIDIIKHRRPTAGLAEPDKIIIDLGREIFVARKVAPETFARAQKQFGAKALVDLVSLMGNYAGTAALLCAFGMEIEPGDQQLLPL